MQYELTGGGIVLTADTATFELIRTVAMKYYLNFPIEFGQINQDVTTDRTTTNIVQMSVKVSSDSSRHYTINIYTTSIPSIYIQLQYHQYIYNFKQILD